MDGVPIIILLEINSTANTTTSVGMPPNPTSDSAAGRTAMDGVTIIILLAPIYGAGIKSRNGKKPESTSKPDMLAQYCFDGSMGVPAFKRIAVLIAFDLE